MCVLSLACGGSCDSDSMNSLQVFEVDTLTSSSHHALQAGPASTEPLTAIM